MKLLNLTLESPFANVALDEALLENAEQKILDCHILRLWEPKSPMVVLGRSSPIQTEVDIEACKLDGVPIIRRCSGGATILSAPGCLMYAVLLSYDVYPQLRMLDAAHQFVMSKIQLAISDLGIATQFQGTCDLTIGNRKVSGNALRCKRNWFIYHGTLICKNMNLDSISKYLGSPKRQPDYRQKRSHEDFLTAIPVDSDDMRVSLIKTWRCHQELTEWPKATTESLVAIKYKKEDWNFMI